MADTEKKIDLNTPIDELPKDDRGATVPIPGDVRTEPVSTAAQSHVKGRVGPPTIAQDSDAPWHTPEDVEQIVPGAEAPADTTFEGGPIALAQPDPAYFGAGPYGADTPADESPNTIRATTPGEGPVTADMLPPGTPVPSNLSASGGPVQVPPAKGAAGSTGAGSGTSETTAAPGSSASPASPAGASASPDAGTSHTATSAQPGSDEHTPSGSDDSGTSTTPAGTSDPAGSTSESGGSTSGATGSTTPNG